MFRWRLPPVLINICEVAKSGVAKHGVAKCIQWQNVSGEKWQWQNVEWQNVADSDEIIQPKGCWF